MGIPTQKKLLWSMSEMQWLQYNQSLNLYKMKSPQKIPK